MQSEEVRKKLETIGAVVVPRERMTPEFLRTYVASEVEKWKGPIQRTGITIN